MPSWMKVALSDLMDSKQEFPQEFPNFGSFDPEPEPEGFADDEQEDY